MKKVFTKHWPLLAIGILGIVVGFNMLRAPEKTVPEPVVKDLGEDEGIKLQDIHYTQDDPGEKVKWDLDAKEVRFSPDRSFFSFKKFRLTLKPEDRPTIALEGNRGDYNKDTQEIKLLGNLHGMTANGYTIHAEHLLYNQKEGILTTDGPVTIEGPFFSVAGHGLFFNLEDEFFRMVSGVTTTIDQNILRS